MAARARKRRVSRSQSCEAPVRPPSPGSAAFEIQTADGFRSALCAEKKFSDEHCGPLIFEPVEKWTQFGCERVETVEVIPRNSMDAWVSSLHDLRAEYEAEMRGEDFKVVPVNLRLPHQVEAQKVQVIKVDEANYMKLAQEVPFAQFGGSWSGQFPIENTKTVVASLFGADAKTSCPQTSKDWKCQYTEYKVADTGVNWLAEVHVTDRQRLEMTGASCTVLVTDSPRKGSSFSRDPWFNRFPRQRSLPNLSYNSDAFAQMMRTP